MRTRELPTQASVRAVKGQARGGGARVQFQTTTKYGIAITRVKWVFWFPKINISLGDI